MTGGAGFLGAHVVSNLRSLGCKIVVPRKADCDLRNRDNIKQLYSESRPDLVIHLAAAVGGIGANASCPGTFFYDNLIMGVELLEQARQFGIPKFVAVGTICAYPKFAPVPFREEDLWEGYPEETNAPYGLAKKMLLVQAQAYRQEFGYNAIYLLPVNLYGPGDNFDLASSHVIPAMIRKFLTAKETGQDCVTMWGDGSPTREFLHVSDAAEAICLAAEHYDGEEPVNVGYGQEVSIRDLAEKIRSLIGYDGRIEWDTSRPNGQPRRMLDVTRARDRFSFQARVSLEEGLSSTVMWYTNHVARFKGQLT